jgi:hypothetical protein
MNPNNLATSLNYFPITGSIVNNTFNTNAPVDLNIYKEQVNGQKDDNHDTPRGLFENYNGILAQLDSEEEQHEESKTSNNYDKDPQEANEETHKQSDTIVTTNDSILNCQKNSTNHAMSNVSEAPNNLKKSWQDNGNDTPTTMTPQAKAFPYNSNFWVAKETTQASPNPQKLNNTPTASYIAKEPALPDPADNRQTTDYFNLPYPNPTNNPSDLSPELEPLRPLIMSQQEVFHRHFFELGNINLTLSKIIEKKRDNYSLLKNNQKIPRSLRIKCELIAPPAYSTNNIFLQLKEKLQDTVSEFIEKGTEIMTEWAVTHIDLLLLDRCFNMLSKALQILDGLASYYAEVIGEPTWPSVLPRYNTLFLLKLYLSNKLIDSSYTSDFFELPKKTILLIGAKILTNKNSDNEAQQIIDSLTLTDVDVSNKIQHDYLVKTLLQFHQILRITTIDIWSNFKQLTKQTLAANNLKAKMMAIDTTNATKATAEAITKKKRKIRRHGK